MEVIKASKILSLIFYFNDVVVANGDLVTKLSHEISRSRKDAETATIYALFYDSIENS